MRFNLLLLSFILASGCVKDEGAVSAGDATDGGTTGTTSGGSTGNPATGSDPLASQAWHLKNTTQDAFSNSSGTLDEDSSIQDVHDMNILGRGVRIAVSDTGTELDHPDLAGNSLSTGHRNYGFATPADWYASPPLPADDNAHGTAVTGLIAALGWNNIGSRGVAPKASFAAFRFVFDYSSSETAASYLAKELDQLYGNFDIFNYSYGADGRAFFDADSTVEDALVVGTSTLRDGKGALYVQSAGNSFQEDSSVDYPFDVSGNTNAHAELATPYRIVVGAVNADGEKSSYSTPGSGIWISAPGGEYGISAPAMISTDLQGCNVGYSYQNILYDTHFNFGYHASNSECHYTSIMNGTSSAAPVTSGVIALMLEARPELTWRDVKHILAVTADKVDFDIFTNTLSHPYGDDLFGYVYDYKWVMNSAGHLFSNWYGFGRVNAKEAVDLAKTFDLTTLGTFAQTKHTDGSWFYSSDTLSGEMILDTSAFALENSIWVGHDYVIENVQIELTVDHDFTGDLGIILQSPDMTESRVLTVNSKIYGEDFDQFVMSTNAFYGEESAGFWTIKIVDGDNTYGGGELLNWKININGHKKSTDLAKPLPPTFITFGAIPGTSDRTPTFGFTDSVSLSSLIRYDAMVERASDGAVIQNWTSIGLSNSANQFTGLTLVSGETYNLKIRAVSSGGVSSIQLKQWTAN